MANPPPFAPSVSNPIYATSTQVYVDSLLPNSTVTVYNDASSTNVVGTGATSTGPGAIWVTLSKPIAAGQFITARQEYTGSTIAVSGISPPSPPVPVLPPPTSLPSPIFKSGMCTCMDSVWIDGLIPGATLTITLVSPTSPPTTTTVVNTKANQSPEWFLLSAVTIAQNSVLKAQQTLGTLKSAIVPSFPIPIAPALGKPVISPAPMACQTSLDLSDLIPGADLKITNGSETASGTNPWSSYTVDGLLPLTAGAVDANQYFIRCDEQKPGPQGSAVVGKSVPLFPKVKYPPCANVSELTVSNLISGEILSISISYNTTSGAVGHSIGAQGVSHESTPVNLPPNWHPSDATGPVTLEISVTLCGVALPAPGYTSVVVGQTGGPYAAPTIVPPLIACATSVNIKGAHVGSVIQVFSGTTAFPLCNPVLAMTANFPITVKPPLSTGESIFVTQQGCNANGTSAHVVVEPAPSKLPVPTIVGPVLVGAESVTISNVVPGAQVTLFVDGEPRMGVDSAQYEITTPTVTPPAVEISMPSGSPALTAGETLTAGQVLCGVTSIEAPGEGGGVPVQAPVPAPGAGPGEPGGSLGSDNNYIMYSPTSSGGCANLLNVSVTIRVTEAIVWESTGPASGCGSPEPAPKNGFSFQMNCYSPIGKLCAWQQYLINFWNTQLLGGINTWPLSGPPIIFPLSLGGEFTEPLGSSLPSTVIPAGYVMTIALGNDPSGNVNSVTWTVNGTPFVQNIPALLTSKGFPATDVAPIVAFTLDLVGPVCSEAAVISAGAGTITYSASPSTPLTVTNTEPGCAEATVFTAETATTSYGVLPANPGNPFTQTFAASASTPLIRRLSKGRVLTKSK
jgi:hypothetical protein